MENSTDATTSDTDIIDEATQFASPDQVQPLETLEREYNRGFIQSLTAFYKLKGLNGFNMSNITRLSLYRILQALIYNLIQPNKPTNTMPTDTLALSLVRYINVT